MLSAPPPPGSGFFDASWQAEWEEHRCSTFSAVTYCILFKYYADLCAPRPRLLFYSPSPSIIPTNCDHLVTHVPTVKIMPYWTACTSIHPSHNASKVSSALTLLNKLSAREAPFQSPTLPMSRERNYTSCSRNMPRTVLLLTLTERGSYFKSQYTHVMVY